MFLGFRSVATDKMAKFMTIYNIKVAIVADHCIVIVMIMPGLIMQLLLVTNPLAT